jgi:integrase/chaperonin cofactor prefoldin
MFRESIILHYRQRIAQGDRSKLSKSELVDLIADFIEQLTAAKSKSQIETLCIQEIALLEEGYPPPTVGKVYLPTYRKALKKAIEDGQLPLTKKTSHSYSYSKRTGETGTTTEHFALTYLKYDTATYGEFAATSADRNNTKQDNLQAVELDAFLAVANNLIQSANPFDLAAGIAATTGRRFSEVVAKGSFTLAEDPYWLLFEGQLKKRTKADRFLTPCLLPAATVLAALKRFRAHPRIIQLAQGTPDELNRSLADSVKRSVKTNFGEIIPILPGERAVSVHNLRGVYAQVCNYYFCPPDRTTARFLQECLGHVISKEELKRSNSSATQYYFHYYLVDQLGHHLAAKGVLLGLEESVEVASEPDANTVEQNDDDPIAVLQAEIGRMWTRVNQPSAAIVDLAEKLATANNRIAVLESALQDTHRRIDQLLTIVQPQIPRNSKQRTPAISKILMAIDAIYLWNFQQPQKFAVSQTLLLKATGCNRPAIQRVLVDLAEEIDRHHAQFSISPRGQARNLDAVLQFIKENINDI